MEWDIIPMSVTVLEAAYTVVRAPVDAVATGDSVLTFGLAECFSSVCRAVGAQTEISAGEVRAVEACLVRGVGQFPLVSCLVSGV
jgi:hypothetical protein